MGTPFFLYSVPQNLFGYSNRMDVGSWIAQVTSIDADISTAPDGTLTATRLNLTSGSHVYYSVYSYATTGANAVSVWVKSLGATHIRFTTTNGLAWSTGISWKFAITSEWMRYTMVGSFLTSVNTRIDAVLGTYDEAQAYDSDCVGQVLVWGAQFENYVTPGPVLTTSGSPSSAVRDALAVEPNYGYLPSGKKEQDTHRTPDGGRYDYRWGAYDRFQIPVSWVGSAFRSTVNSWWQGNANLLWTEDYGFSTHSVRIVNEDTPIGVLMAPYIDQWGGTIDLETY